MLTAELQLNKKRPSSSIFNKVLQQYCSISLQALCDITCISLCLCPWLFSKVSCLLFPFPVHHLNGVFLSPLYWCNAAWRKKPTLLLFLTYTHTQAHRFEGLPCLFQWAKCNNCDPDLKWCICTDLVDANLGTDQERSPKGTNRCSHHVGG